MVSLLTELAASVEQIKRERGCDCLVGQCKELEHGCQKRATLRVLEANQVTTTEKQLDTVAGKVSEIGMFDNRPIKVKLEGRGDEWIMFSKPEYRGRWEDPQRGDNVKFGVSRYKDAWWAETCEIQKRGNGAQSTYDAGQVPSGGKELLVLRESCVKSAAPIIAAWVSRLSAEVVFDHAMVSRNVLGLAQDFEAWMLREDPPFS